MKRLLSFILVLLGLSAWATTYYVSSTGSDANSGTSTGTPWLTVSNASVKASVNDTVLLDSGGTTLSNWAILPKNGQTWASYGGGRAQMWGNTNDGCLNATNISNVTISNLYFSGIYPDTNDFPNYPIVQLTTTTTNGTQYTNDVITGCFITGGSYGINFNSTGTNWGDGYSSCRFSGLTISNCTDSGIEQQAGDYDFFTPLKLYQFTNNFFSSNEVERINGVTAYTSGMGIQITCGVDCVVESNYIHDCGQSNLFGAGGGPVGTFFDGCVSNVSQFNTVARQHTETSVDGAGMGMDNNTFWCISQYNVVSNCDGAGIYQYSPTTGASNIIRFNIFVSNSISLHSDIYVQQGSSDRIYNNTIISRGKALDDSGGSGDMVYNNLMTSGGTIASYASSTSQSNNLAIPVYGVPNWMNQTWYPAANSPAFNAAIFVPDNGGRDVYGNSLGNFAYNIGAVSGHTGNLSYLPFYMVNRYTYPNPTNLWYKMDDGSGTTAADSSGRGVTATLSGSTKPSWTTGPTGNGALSFNGTTAYLDLGTASKAGTVPKGSISVYFWAKSSSTNASCIISCYDSTNDFSVTFNGNTSGPNANSIDISLYYNSFGNGTEYDAPNVNQISDGQWHFYMVLFNRATSVSTFFIDGNPVALTLESGASVDLNTPVTFSQNFCIGAQQDNGTIDSFFNGTIDDFHLTGQDMTGLQAQLIYAGPQ